MLDIYLPVCILLLLFAGVSPIPKNPQTAFPVMFLILLWPLVLFVMVIVLFFDLLGYFDEKEDDEEQEPPGDETLSEALSRIEKERIEEDKETKRRDDIKK